MSCYHPLTARRSFDRLAQKFVTKIVPGIPFEDLDTINALPENRATFTSYFQVPCGHCVGCLLDRSLAWVTRCSLEERISNCTYFVTATYDDDHLPVRPVFNGRSLVDLPVLDKRDHQLFLKRFRRKLSLDGLSSPRYFACGEYGETTHRPHMHYLLFCQDALPDLRRPTLEETSGRRPPPDVMTSDFLRESWGNGHVSVSPVNPARIAYVCRYTLKKLHALDLKVAKDAAQAFAASQAVDQVTGEVIGDLDKYTLPAEFVVYSQGIGRGYAVGREKELADQRSVPVLIGSKVCQRPLPSSVVRQIERELGEGVLTTPQRVKDNLKLKQNMEQSGTDLPHHRYLEVKESALLDRLKSSNRKPI